MLRGERADVPVVQLIGNQTSSCVDVIPEGAGQGQVAGWMSPKLGPWHVLHTRSRQEKVVAADLAALGVGCYLPLVRHGRLYGGRRAVIEVPLFPGYVFLRGAVEQAYQVDRMGRIAHILRVANQEQLDWELRNLYVALSREGVLEAYPALIKGVRVEVRSGPFRGLQGVVEERGSAGRLILQVEMLGRAVSLEIDGALLEPMAGMVSSD